MADPSIYNFSRKAEVLSQLLPEYVIDARKKDLDEVKYWAPRTGLVYLVDDPSLEEMPPLFDQCELLRVRSLMSFLSMDPTLLSIFMTTPIIATTYTKEELSLRDDFQREISSLRDSVLIIDPEDGLEDVITQLPSSSQTPQKSVLALLSHLKTLHLKKVSMVVFCAPSDGSNHLCASLASLCTTMHTEGYRVFGNACAFHKNFRLNEDNINRVPLSFSCVRVPPTFVDDVVSAVHCARGILSRIKPCPPLVVNSSQKEEVIKLMTRADGRCMMRECRGPVRDFDDPEIDDLHVCVSFSKTAAIMSKPQLLSRLGNSVVHPKEAKLDPSATFRMPPCRVVGDPLVLHLTSSTSSWASHNTPMTYVHHARCVKPVGEQVLIRPADSGYELVKLEDLEMSAIVDQCEDCMRILKHESQYFE